MEELRQSSSGRRLVGGSEKSRQLVTLKAYEGELFGGWPDIAVGHQGRQLGRKAGGEAEENEQIGTYEGKLSLSLHLTLVMPLTCRKAGACCCEAMCRPGTRRN